MKPILKLYIKAFLLIGLLYASLMAISEYIYHESFSFVSFLFHATFFGGLMSAALVSIHKYNLSDQGITDPSEENLKAVQQTEFISKVSKAEFISRLSKDKVTSKMELKTEDEILKLNTGVTWRSWGEKIEIRISSVSEGMFKYQVQSKPKLSTTIIDFGKNIENILLIQKLVNNDA